MDVNLETVEALIALATENNLAELSVEHHDLKVTVKTALGTTTMLPSTSFAEMASMSATSIMASAETVTTSVSDEPPSASSFYKVTSPMVGTFYASSSPDAAPFAKVGDRVSKGQTLCIIEAMKLMNELESEVSGIVRKINAHNASPVEYGQPLMEIETSD